jgi:hypothetical protein
MGFMEKMKNLFTEEEEIIEPVKKEVMQVEIKAPVPKKETVRVPEVDHVIAPLEEMKTSGPVFFDDKDFVNLEQPKPKPKRKEEVPAKRTERPTYHQKDRREKHVFEPSPIISPVYGILDKNYKKEDIVNKGEDFVSSYYHETTRELTVDEVRKKAFGTLEDDIDLNLHTESALQDDDLVLENQFGEESLENDIFEEMNVDHLTEPVIDQTDDITIGNVEESPAMAHAIESDNMVEEALNQEVEDQELDENDLFHLIDSMYEKRDEE